MKMKLLVLFVCIFGLQTSQAKVKFNRYEDECIEELGVDKEEIREAFSYTYFPENNPTFQSVLVCAWKKEGIIDELYNLNMENFRKFLVDNFARAHGSNYLIASLVTADTMFHCENVRGRNVGETAVRISNCILRRLDSYDD